MNSLFLSHHTKNTTTRLITMLSVIDDRDSDVHHSHKTWRSTLLVIALLALIVTVHSHSSSHDTEIVVDTSESGMENLSTSNHMIGHFNFKQNPIRTNEIHHSYQFSNKLPDETLISSHNARKFTQTNSVVNNDNTTKCPFIIYASHWQSYLKDPKNRNTEHKSDLDKLVNTHIPLFNQTEWSLKFSEQVNPLSCPAFTLNKWRSYVPLINEKEDILYYLGEEINFCEKYSSLKYVANVTINGTIVERNFTYHFRFDQICDRLFCFPNRIIEKLGDKVSKFGLNLTQLYVNTTLLTDMYPPRIALNYFTKWANSYTNGQDIDPNSLLVSKYTNEMMHYLIPYLPYNFSSLNYIQHYFTMCTSCRDYNKYPILPGRDVCMHIDYPFSCMSQDGQSVHGFPLMETGTKKNAIFKNVMNYKSEPMCYCPRPGSVKNNSLGNDVTWSSSSFFSTKTAAQCDQYTYFWYPLLDSKYLNILLLLLEVILNLILFFIVLTPLLVQFVKEIIMKKNRKALKIPRIWLMLFPNSNERVTAIDSSKSREIEKDRSFFTTSSINSKRSWKRILFDLRLYSAISLQFGYICFAISDLVAVVSNIDSIASLKMSEPVMFLTGAGFCLIGTIPILTLWVDVMKKTERNSERISLKVSIPLFLLMSFGIIGVISYAITAFFTEFISSAVFMLSLVIFFTMILFGLLVYGIRIFLSLRKVSNISFFQFRVRLIWFDLLTTSKFTRFLIIAVLLSIFPGFYMVFNIIGSIYQSQVGFYPNIRSYYLFSSFFASALIIGVGASLIYVLFPSLKLLSESYQILIYCTLFCCGKSPMVKRFIEEQKKKQEDVDAWSTVSSLGGEIGRLPYNNSLNRFALESVENQVINTSNVGLAVKGSFNPLIEEGDDEEIKNDESMFMTTKSALP